MLLAICEPVVHEGFQFQYYREARIFYDAQRYCVNLGGNLASITSQEEQDIAEDLCEPWG